MDQYLKLFHDDNGNYRLLLMLFFFFLIKPIKFLKGKNSIKSCFISFLFFFRHFFHRYPFSRSVLCTVAFLGTKPVKSRSPIVSVISSPRQLRQQIEELYFAGITTILGNPTKTYNRIYAWTTIWSFRDPWGVPHNSI